MTKKLDLLGKRFGFLTVIAENPIRYIGEVCWDCGCACGNLHTVRGHYLKSGITKSCGCKTVELQREKKFKPNSPSKHPLYTTWRGMKCRCYVPTTARYKDWGGRGIYVCDRWRNSFTNFLQDMGERPLGKTLDRIDNDGPYSPENCKWSTLSEQQLNSRKVKCTPQFST